MLRKNKRGNFADVFVYMPIALYLGILIVFAIIFLSQISDVLSKNEISTITNITNYTSETQDILDNDMPLTLDLIIPFFYISFLFFSVFMARKLDISNKMVLIGVIMLIILFFVSLFFENIWDTILNMSNLFGTTANNTFFTKHFLNNMRWAVLIYGGAVGIALYTKDN